MLCIIDEEERWEVSLCFGSYANPTDIPQDSGPYETIVVVIVFTFFLKIFYSQVINTNYIVHKCNNTTYVYIQYNILYFWRLYFVPPEFFIYL